MNENKKSWVHKYEPKTLTEMVLDDSVRSLLQSAIDTKVSLILWGPSGCGKGTFTNILLSQPDPVKPMFDTEFNHLWFNAADKTGIDTIREIVKPHCQGAAAFGSKNVVFNEADRLSKKVQAILLELIEKSTAVRFIFMTNKIKNIDNQLISRCVDVEFLNPPEDEILSFVERVLKLENIQYDVKTVEHYVGKFQPDMRKIITTIQLCISSELR